MEVYQILWRTNHSQTTLVLGSSPSTQQLFSLSWMCSNDFNEIVRNLEKKGGSNRSHMQMQNFREVINACGFIDMGYKGIPFTWKKLYRDGHSIWERLDRSMATSDWLTQFGGSLVHHLTCSTSNYSPLLILLEVLVTTIPNKSFQLEEMWLSKKGCLDTVKSEWGK